VAGVFVSLVSRDAAGWAPVLAEGLVRRRARRLSPEQQERWVDEWVADLAIYRDRPLTVMLHAIGIATFGVRGVGAEIEEAARSVRVSDDGRRALRFLVEAVFLGLLAAALVVADVKPLVIGGIMLAGWLVVALYEWAATRELPHRGRGL
jgi:hypothetical protein